MYHINFGPEIDKTYCIGCKACYEACPMDIFGWDEERKKPFVAYSDECRICNACELVCPQAAIDVKYPVHMMIELGIPMNYSLQKGLLE